MRSLFLSGWIWLFRGMTRMLGIGGSKAEDTIPWASADYRRSKSNFSPTPNPESTPAATDGKFYVACNCGAVTVIRFGNAPTVWTCWKCGQQYATQVMLISTTQPEPNVPLFLNRRLTELPRDYTWPGDVSWWIARAPDDAEGEYSTRPLRESPTLAGLN